MSAIPTAPLNPGTKPVNIPFAIPMAKNINADHVNIISQELKKASVRPMAPTLYKKLIAHIQRKKVLM
jgi:hypothetical protein